MGATGTQGGDQVETGLVAKLRSCRLACYTPPSQCEHAFGMLVKLNLPWGFTMRKRRRESEEGGRD